MSRQVTYSPAYTIVPTYECFNLCTYCNFRSDPGQSPWLTLKQAEAKMKPLISFPVASDSLDPLLSRGRGNPRVVAPVQREKMNRPLAKISLTPPQPSPYQGEGANFPRNAGHALSVNLGGTLGGNSDASGFDMTSEGVCEILILSGEVHPHSQRRKAWFGLIYDLCELALSMGFLPHTNAGPLSYEEMLQIKNVNVSMGLMLEQVTPQLLETVHKHAPSKVPEIRLQQMEWAGELRIPFTTGLLLGIGETEKDWWETLEAIAHLHERWGHIQEVILQPHSPGHQQTFDAPAFDPQTLPEVIAKAREILPPDITLQIPPNLVKDPSWLLACLEAGARDLGGIGPKDEVNPDYPHPHYQQLAEILEPAGWELVPRLPVYPQYDDWLSERLQTSVKRWRTAIPSFPSFPSLRGSAWEC